MSRRADDPSDDIAGQPRLDRGAKRRGTLFLGYVSTHWNCHQLCTVYFTRGLVDRGMRAGIPDPAARERTATLYLDTGAFRAALDLPSEAQIYSLLVAADGTVVWKWSGTLSGAAEESLRTSLRARAGGRKE